MKGRYPLYMNNPIVREDLEDIFARNEVGWEEFANKSFLITGATGMLPSYLVYFFIYLNEVKQIPVKVFAFVRNESKAKKFFGEYLTRNYLELVIGDLCNEFYLEIAVDYIVHGASLASPKYYKTNPVETLLPNVLGTYRLLEYSRSQKLCNFLFLSSGAIYGYKMSETAVSEGDGGWVDPLSTEACYAESKRMGETMCLAWYRQRQVPARIVRIRHTYGPTLNLRNDDRSFSYFVNCLFEGEDIILKSDGSEEIEFLYISDAIEGILRIILYGQDGEAYNLSNSRERIAISELADMILSYEPEKRLQVRKSTDEAQRKGGVRKTDTTKLESLGWVPRISIKSGFYRTVRAIKSMKVDPTE